MFILKFEIVNETILILSTQCETIWAQRKKLAGQKKAGKPGGKVAD